MEGALLISILVFLLVAQSVWLAAPVPQRSGERITDRIRSYVTPTWDSNTVQRTLSILRQRRYSRLPWFEALLQRFNLSQGLSTELLKAGLPIRAGEFILIQLVVATVTATVSLFLLGPLVGGLFAAGGAAIVGFLAPMVWLRFKRGQRLNVFDEALPDALDLLAGSLRAGYGLAHGLDLVARNNSGPAGEEFGQVLQEVNLGADLDVALSRVVERVESEDARLLATAVAVQRRTGGNLVEVLQQLGAVIRERQRLRRDVRVITTAPRVSGYVVALLPVLTVGTMFLTSRYYIDILFSSPSGRMAAGVGGVLVLIGLYLNHRIASVDM